ncbi:MAG: replication-relaxation family protein [Myxococcales bacterium]|nr:replication-relaxation family protein [Myxococcales bacterium]
MARINELSILRLLLDAPMTCGWLLHASASFPRPYRSLARIREVMAALHARGLVKRVPMLELHQGQRRWLYYLAPAARRLVPEIADLRPGSGPLAPPADPRAHALAVAEFVAHLHRAAGEAGERARVLESLRDGALRAEADLPEAKGKRQRLVVPDHTFLVEVDGAPQLLLLELQNRGAVILPASPQSVARSFRFKLAKHKAFLAGFREHPLVAQMVAAHGPLPGFRVLVVTTRTESSMRHLLSAAGGYAKLFYFTTLDRVRAANLILDPIWELPSGAVRAIAD